ncbi:MAG: NUDIX domain-containing protein [Candidatus Sungbacteria bacterium]|nr:NUDIX domain-containing protein [Candidatus Sungbacteria bacterium]
MHFIQQHILKLLTYGGAKRYSDLKPSGVEGNRFMYHLNRLIAGGYIRKTKSGYFLAAFGNRYVDKLSLKTFTPRIQPKIVTVLLCRNKAGEYLTYTRNHEPFKNLLAFPYGKLHLTETIYEAAARELKEKTGLAGKLSHRGDVYLKIFLEKEFITHMLCHVFEGKDLKGTLVKESDYGSCRWQALDAAKSKEWIPGFLEIEKLCRKGPARFFDELTLL